MRGDPLGMTALYWRLRIEKNNAAVMVSNTSHGITPAQEQFFHATKAAAVEGVVETIEEQVERLLPEGISNNASNRVVGEIYRELGSTLRANDIGEAGVAGNEGRHSMGPREINYARIPTPTS
jgi:hypothetical protein